MSDTYRLPTIIPNEAKQLIEDFAHENRLKFNDAIRQLLAESPRLVEFANKNKREIDFEVDGPGGYRPKKE